MRGRLDLTTRFPVMKVVVDFDNVGFGYMENWTDISDYVLDISGSKEKEGEVLGGASSDIISFTVDNSENVFSVDNPSSLFYQKSKSNLRFALMTGFKDEFLEPNIVGYIHSMQPRWKSKEYVLKATCPMEKLKRADAPTETFYDIAWDQLVSSLLDKAGIEPYFIREIPKTELFYKYFKFEEKKCFDGLKRLMEAVAGQSFFDGRYFKAITKLEIGYTEDRTPKHEIIAEDFFEFEELINDNSIVNTVSIISDPKEVAPLQVVAETPENLVKVQNEQTNYDGTEYVYIDMNNRPIYWEDGAEEITIKNLSTGMDVEWDLYNAELGRIHLTPTAIANMNAGDLLSLSYTYQYLVLLPGQERKYTFQTEDVIDVFLEPDVVAWNADATAQVTYSTTPDVVDTVSKQSMTTKEDSNIVEVTLKNNTSGKISISTLQLRGYPVKVLNPIEVYNKDQTSIDANDTREVSITNNYINNVRLAEKISQFIIDTGAEIKKELNVKINGYSELMLNDPTSVVEPSSGTDHLMTIDRIDFTFNVTNGWTADLTLVEVPDSDWFYGSFLGESYAPPQKGTPDSTQAYHKGTEPPTDKTLFWIDTNTTPNITKVYDQTTGTWVKTNPTTAGEIGAETPQGAQDKADQAYQDAVNSSNGYTNTEVAKRELSVFKQPTTPTATTLNQLWIDTSSTPYMFKKWNGTTWEVIGPENAEDVGAVSQLIYDADINDGTVGLKVRMGNAESSISQNADEIALRVTKVEFVKSVEDFKNLCPTSFGFWETGHYSQTDGAKAVSTTRVRTKDLIKVTPSTAYYFHTNHATLQFVVRAYDVNGIFTRSLGAVTNGFTLTTNSSEGYIGVSLFEGTSYQQFENEFASGAIKPFICINTVSDKTFQRHYLDNVGSRLTDAESSIVQNANEIQLKVSQETYEIDIPNLQSRMSTAESSITQNASNIELKVSKDGVISSINQSAETIQIEAENINLVGAISLSHFSSTLQTDFNSKVDGTYVGDAIDGIQVGGRNIYKDSFLKRVTPYGSSVVTIEGSTPTNIVRCDNDGTGTSFGLVQGADDRTISLRLNREYIMTFEARGNVDLNYNYMMRLDGTNNSWSGSTGLLDATNFQKFTFKRLGPWDSDQAYFLIGSNNILAGNWFEIKNIQVELGNKETDWSPCPEDVNEEINTLVTRVSNAELKIEDDSIVSIVTESITFQNALSSKADAESIGGLATIDELDALDLSIEGRIDEKIGLIDLTPYATVSQLEQTSTDITAKFSATGGMNLLRNSIGFADDDFWDASAYADTRISYVSNQALDTLGFGSGFYFYPVASGSARYLAQTVTVEPGQEYTLSWYMNKTNDTQLTGNDGAIVVQILEDDGTETGTDVSIAQRWYYDTDKTVGYEPDKFTFIPNQATVKVRIYGYGLADATATGLMLTIGDVALQWSLATGEVYNTNVRTDINGIRVSRLDEDRNEVGYTEITPDSFAGYYDTNGDGNYEKVFYLEEEETVSKKFRAQEEFTMGSIKIISVQGGGNDGWAFVPIVPE